MKRTLVFILFASYALAQAASNVAPRVSRISIAAMEDSFDRRIGSLNIDDPFSMIGGTRGMYINGYGAVFAAEMNLVANNLVTPFRPQVTKDDLLRLKHKKQQRLGILKDNMRGMLVSTAASLDGVPPNEQIVLGVTLFYYSWEDSSGLPRQIVMLAPRKLLVEAAKGNSTALDAALQVQEY
jgi:hypothetical protein